MPRPSAFIQHQIDTLTRERDEARAEAERLQVEVARRLVPVFDSEIQWRNEAERLASALGLIANGRWNANADEILDVRTFARRVLRGPTGTPTQGSDR